MLSLLILILAGYGMANILTFGKILDMPRNEVKGIFHAAVSRPIGRLASNAHEEQLSVTITEFAFCIMCVGFWAGLATHFLMYLSPTPPPSNFFLDACIVSGASWAIDSVVTYLELEDDEE